MKKAIVVALTAGLLAGALVGPADAGKKKKKPPVPPAPVKVERIVEIEYQMPGLGATTPTGIGGGICPLADPASLECINVPLEAGEAYIKVAIADTAGQTVAGYLSQGDTDGDGIGNLYGDFCGAHEEPVELLSQSVPVGISFYNGASSTDCPSIATNGTITATMSNLP